MLMTTDNDQTYEEWEHEALMALGAPEDWSGDVEDFIAYKIQEARENERNRIATYRTPLERALDETDTTQAKLAEHCEVSQAVISKWSAGKFAIPYQRLSQLDDFFEGAYDFEDMVALEEEAPEQMAATMDNFMGRLLFMAEVNWDTDAGAIAKELAVPKQTVLAWRAGKKYPTLEQAERFVLRYMPGTKALYGL